MANTQVYLKDARYGKDLVRFMRVYRNGPQQVCSELTVRLLLEGDIETSYTKADNSVVVPTDTCKNTVNVLGKRSKNCENIEVFGQEITEHMLKMYGHISGVIVEILKHKWTRMIVDGKPHPHSFVRDGEELSTTRVYHQRAGNKVTITSGLKNLLVLKTTGSAFHGFHMCEYTTLPEVWDRIFSTAIDCKWTFESHNPSVLRRINYQAIHEGVKEITMATFANDDSASVQATMYLMQQQILGRFPEVAEIEYTLPNKHYVQIDLSKFGIDNSGKNLDLYYPQADPSGLINCTVARKPNAKL
ncbi:uncharacterized protein BYT42DRAFT_563862 [Radiomyces spectabilis]|uniref:uncharacterized protein n=1 Tax=Radiomyces spectabilis TaxID=64574 RepID=UPI00221E79F1|nr:uncharacterized protein BYT42DRAFT_563862 [Radiomyces spectabilis]KAI8384852.1 hypothetical protein BYT42DRAFT_563862 [Radiomyces spectabilis]